MKKYVIKPGEKRINALHLQEMTSRELKCNEVGVRVHATSLNYRDLINVIMGTGGVALFALQLAKNIGARVILLSSKDEKLEKAKEMGADDLINYKKNPNWEKLVLEKTSQVGADLVLELGGGGTLAKSMASAT